MMKIRQAQLADLNRMMQIEQENFIPEEAATLEAMRERLTKSATTCLVVESGDGQTLLGYISSVPTTSQRLSDELFEKIDGNPKEGGYLAILSLSILSEAQGQGIGTMLLAALKDLALAQKRDGIILTCHPELVSYYELSQFKDMGESQSTHGGSQWIDMLWLCTNH